ncbi:MAG TPA: tetratricopeptide repeat protein [Terriglobia bacterium]|nr:tetratricopeptide repeat protein [Terriglobia bacterium]
MGHFFARKKPHQRHDRTRFRIVLTSAVVFLALTLPPDSVGAATSFGQAGASPGSADKELSEIDTLIDTNHLQEAQELLQKEIHARGESYEILFREAKLFFREKKYRDSLSVLRRCLALTQEDPEAYKLVASNAILIGRMDIAETALNTAAKLAPDDFLVFFNLGALYYTDSRFSQAQPPLEKSLKLNPDYVPARLFLGLTLEELGQEREAIECYHLAIKTAETSGFKGEQPYLYLGRLLYRENRMDESLPYLQKAVKANPQSCEALCLLARVHMYRSRDAEAMEALNQCLRADPQYPESHYLLSRIYVKQGKTDDAAKELSMFQQLKRVERNEKDPRKNQRAMP